MIPHIRDAQLGTVTEAIAFEFFGIDAYTNPNAANPMVKVELHSFVQTLLSYIWNQARKATKSQFERLEKGKKEVMDEYASTYHRPRCCAYQNGDTCISELEGVNATDTLCATDLMPWLRRVDKLLVLAAAFKDTAGKNCLLEQLRVMGDMHKMLTGKADPSTIQGEWSAAGAPVHLARIPRLT